MPSIKRPGSPSIPSAGAAAPSAPAAPAAGSSTPAAPEGSGPSIAGGLAANAPTVPAPSAGVAGAEAVKKLAQADKANGEKIDDILTKPTSQSSTMVTYKLGGSGRVVKPGHSLYFMVPEELSGRSVNFMILGHAGPPELDTDPDKSDEWDSTPALTSVQVHGHNLDADDAWRYWGGASSGQQGAKFARLGNHAELENLYEWRKQGHRSVKTGSSSGGELLPDAMRIRSVGDDPIVIYELSLKVMPPKADSHQEVLFSSSAGFGDPETHKGVKYGRDASAGTYPGALALGGWGSNNADAIAKLPEGWKVNGSQLEIEAPAGKHLSQIEVICGDTHPDGKPNRDGGTGTKGWAKLSMSLKKADGTTVRMMDRENVPSKGVMMASLDDLDYVLQPGDKLLISSSSDTTYVTGVRIGTREAE